MIFADSICTFLCIANVIMHFRRLVYFINSWLNSLQTGAPLAVVWILIWFSVLTGLVYFNLAMYGN